MQDRGSLRTGLRTTDLEHTGQWAVRTEFMWSGLICLELCVHVVWRRETGCPGLRAGGWAVILGFSPDPDAHQTDPLLPDSAGVQFSHVTHGSLSPQSTAITLLSGGTYTLCTHVGG